MRVVEIKDDDDSRCNHFFLFVRLGCLCRVGKSVGMGSCLSLTEASSLPSMDACDEPLCSPITFSDYRIEMRVHRVPGRLFLNGSSQVASLFCKQGNGTINQDAMLLWDNFCSKDDAVFCGVFDGHGPHGHLVAKKLRDSFPLKLIAQWNSINPNTTYSYRNFFNTSFDDFQHDSVAPTNIATLRQSFVRACKTMDSELRDQNQIDCSSSGSTAVILLKQVSITSHHLLHFFTSHSFIHSFIDSSRVTTLLLPMSVTPELYWLPKTVMVPLLPFS